MPISGSRPLSALTGYAVIVQEGAEVDYMATTVGVVVQNCIIQSLRNRRFTITATSDNFTASGMVIAG